jgi:acetyl-CoA synthetase
VITDAPSRSKVGFAKASPVPVICAGSDGGKAAGDIDFEAAIKNAPDVVGVPRSGDDLHVLLYTSGTTGQPKGVEVPVRALTEICSYMRHGLDLRSDDVYWNMADPGWAYGLYYGVLGPLLLGQTTLWRAGAFDPREAFAAISDHGVTNLAGAPTVYRALRAAGVPDGFRERQSLRVVSSAGEPLNAELLDWSRRGLGVPIHDHYGQTELGMAVTFAHHPELRREPVAGAMGFHARGYRAVVLGEDGEELGPGVDGEVAIDVEASPVYWFRGYFREPERSAERFRHGPRYYLTGDSARLDESGLFYFASRADDVIISSGYRVGPFEIESALMAHPSVAEVAVIGTPDEKRGEAVTAFIVISPSVRATSELAEELQLFVKSRLAKHLSPRRVLFVDSLPRTPSGKIQRTVLRARWRSQHMTA